MSEIRVTTISDAAGTGPVTLTKQQAAKVWNNVDQRSTQTIQGSFNVSSITDTATGFTTTTFTSAMSNTNYSITACCEYNSMQGTNGAVSSTSTVGIAILNSGGSYEDRDDTCLQIQGDLA